jgi:hypothetical protein
VDFKSPVDELEEFLAAQPSWLQKILQLDYSLSREEFLAWHDSVWWWQDTQRKVEAEYLRLVRRCPDKWSVYCARRRKIALAGLPTVSSGRPRKDPLAQEAVDLKRAGLSYTKIAIKLNSKYGPGTTTAGAVRQLIGSRKCRSAQTGNSS